MQKILENLSNAVVLASVFLLGPGTWMLPVSVVARAHVLCSIITRELCTHENTLVAAISSGCLYIVYVECISNHYNHKKW